MVPCCMHPRGTAGQIEYMFYHTGKWQAYKYLPLVALKYCIQRLCSFCKYIMIRVLRTMRGSSVALWVFGSMI